MDVLLEWLEERIGLSRADAVGVAVALLGAVVAVVVALRVPLLAHVAAPEAVGPAAATATDDPATPVGGPLVVHVAGAVHRPGVVQLRVGDRVADALDAVGGTLPDASLTALNLARPLVDGEQVMVPTAAEVAAAPTGEQAGQQPAGARLPDGRLDINRATAAELEELPGVGPVLAARIVAHREQQGAFSEAAALREVSGIGEATWASLRDLVGVR